MKKVLVACERSQVVTTAFRQLGADAYSCDIARCMGIYPEYHLQCDVRELLSVGSWCDSWDLIIAHPPCTMLSRVSAVVLSKGIHTMNDIASAREFFLMFTNLGVPTCIENPIPLRVARLPKPTQYVCPSMFGHPYTKKTCLWLYDLPPLLPMGGYYVGVGSWVKKVGGNQTKRSRFFEGIAQAMAAQWLPII